MIEGDPYVSMVPFAIRQDFTGLIIHASRLARHTKGLAEGSKFGILIHVAEAPGRDPLQLPRVSLQGHVRVLSTSSGDYELCKEAYLQKFPQSEQTFALGDFSLYSLDLVSGRFVAGFAHTLNLNADHFRQLALVK